MKKNLQYLVCIISITCYQIAYAGSVAGDKAALQKIYTSLNGPQWKNKRDWNSTKPLDEWYGINTDANGRVTEILLYSNDLQGVIPPEIKDLDKLVMLNFDNNHKISGNIPRELGQLSNLVRIGLNGNQLTGSIPKEIGLLTNLQYLYLYTNELTGSIPVELANLTNLIDLMLHENSLTGSIPKQLGTLTSLRQLMLYSNELTGSIPAELGNLLSLTRLRMHDNQLSGTVPAKIASISGTKYIRQNLFLFEDLKFISSMGFSIQPQNSMYDSSYTIVGRQGDPLILTTSASDPNNQYQWYKNNMPISGATSSTYLIPSYSSTDTGYYQVEVKNSRFSGMTIMGDTIFVNECDDRCTLMKLFEATNDTGNTGYTWKDYTNWGTNQPLDKWFGIKTDANGRVIEINLRDNGLKGILIPEISNLDELRFLYLGANYLGDTLPSSLGKLKKLEQLWLGRNNFYGNVPKELGQMSALEQCFIAENDLTGSIPKELGNLNQLDVLNLSDNQLSGNIPNELMNATSLEILQLNSNNLSGSIPSNIGNLTNLSRLYLQDNSLSGSLPSSIGQLSFLQYFIASHNELSGIIPNSISDLVSLKELNLSFNQFTGQFPDSLQKMSALRNLILHQNQISELPESLTKISLNILNVSANRLQFEMMDDISAFQFSYIAQDTLYKGNTVQYGNKWRTDTLHISESPLSSKNKYQWFKDGSPIAGATDSIFIIDTVLLNREGKYYAEITNTEMPGLMLIRDTINYFVDPVTLPIELEEFTVMDRFGRAHLYWSTFSEINTDYFSIRRSSNGINWQEIGSLNGCGTCSYRNQYRFIDQSPLTGISYYSLIQYDQNGQFEFIGPVAFNNSKNHNSKEIIVFPTITDGQINVIFNEHCEGNSKLQLVAFDGKVVQEWSLQCANSKVLQLNNAVQSGTYVLNIRNDQFMDSYQIVVKK